MLPHLPSQVRPLLGGHDPKITLAVSKANHRVPSRAHSLASLQPHEGLCLISSQGEFRETPSRTPCLGGSRCKLCPSLEASGAGQTGSEQETLRALSATEHKPETGDSLVWVSGQSPLPLQVPAKQWHSELPQLSPLLHEARFRVTSVAILGFYTTSLGPFSTIKLEALVKS